MSTGPTGLLCPQFASYREPGPVQLLADFVIASLQLVEVLQQVAVTAGYCRA